MYSSNSSQRDWAYDFNSENTLTLVVNASMEDGFYYFYPILFDSAGNPSSTIISCSEKRDESFALDTTIPVANIQPEIGEKLAYNSDVLLSLYASDNMGLKEARLVYGYSEDFNPNLPDFSFSSDIQIFPLTNISNLSYEENINFNFSNGEGTYRFFFEVDDINLVSSFI